MSRSADTAEVVAKRVEVIHLMMVNGYLARDPAGALVRVAEYVTALRLDIDQRYELEEALGADPRFGDAFRQAAGRVPGMPGA